MISKYFASLLSLAAFVPLSQSSLLKPTELDVWVPSIFYPHAGIVWEKGETHNVKWDASNPPSQITNPYGKIYLVKDNLILFDRQLASDFALSGGQVGVKVPTDIDSGIYQLVLMGDSGNWSDEFTIQ
ncbi:hypothetical protein JVU11DRAFT_1139 [Chiua virens]|nr:hypothetical protein JVU11DRAFT_10210 [Chiua virens]KAG9316959.1 hypothetical protein JVU11DRAFT_1139 [Chiua virens]